MRPQYEDTRRLVRRIEGKLDADEYRQLTKLLGELERRREKMDGEDGGLPRGGAPTVERGGE